MENRNISAVERATAAINRRRDGGQFGRTDALAFILDKYRVDLSDWLNASEDPRLQVGAVHAVEIALELLKVNHRAAILGQRVAREAGAVVINAQANALHHACTPSSAFDLSESVELAALIGQALTLMRLLDAAVGPFSTNASRREAARAAAGDVAAGTRTCNRSQAFAGGGAVRCGRPMPCTEPGHGDVAGG